MEKNNKLVELGKFLKTKREMISPEKYGIKVDSRRRVKGLKREEVATFSNVSLSIYTWLEQGKDISVSNETLERISKTLYLTEAEKKFIFLQIKQYIPVSNNNNQVKIDSALRNILDNFSSFPALIINNQFDILAWNKYFTLIFGDYNLLPVKKRNSLRKMFFDPDIRKLIENWEESAKRLIAVFRQNIAYDLKDNKDQNKDLLEELLKNSPEFKKWWEIIQVKEDTSDIKIINHPELGKKSYKHISFKLIDNPNLNLVLYVPIENSNS